MGYVLILLIGIFIGAAFVRFIFEDKPIGTLRVMKNDEKNSDPYMFLELDRDCSDKLRIKKIVRLRVNLKDVFTRE